jgi:cytochrome c-type biogenesis protein CcmH/NrfG
MEREHYIPIKETPKKIFLGGFMIMVFILFILILAVGNEKSPQQIAEKLKNKEKQLQQKEEKLKQLQQQLKAAR